VETQQGNGKSKLGTWIFGMALGLLALSFPVGLLVLNAPVKSLVTGAGLLGSDSPAAINRFLETKTTEIESLDGRILEARGELLKYQEKRAEQLGELKALYDQLGRVIDETAAKDVPGVDATSK
jgi:hypothetical protein